MFERSISEVEVKRTLQSGELIEDHDENTSHPSRLILGWRGKRPIHVVTVDHAGENETIIITAYRPDPEQWKSDFMRRKR